MKTSLFFLIRCLLPWVALFLVILSAWSGISERSPPDLLIALMGIVLGWVVATAFSHLRRVRLMVGALDSGVLANHQRRQIEIPFEAGEAFDMVDAAIRELPRTEQIESARDSLQIRAKVQLVDQYASNAANPAAQQRPRGLAQFLRRRNQITVTVTPSGGAGSALLICEPEGGAWVDWFILDGGTNLENAEAITRALSRRVAERRRSEQAKAEQTVTEKELTVAKLSLLHAQVEPHFLYNTLGSAQYLIRSEPDRADQMLGHLIRYLRHSLPRTQDTPSTLGDELERAKAYLEILKIRMGERLSVHIDVADYLHTVPFPPMMLQTLVENAIKHGLEPKPGGGTIWILARTFGGRTDGSVSITVADDGRGFASEGESTSGTGIGLDNVRERLRLAYGDTASFAIGGNFPAGVAATITVPATGPKKGTQDA
jgi:signal transduction histidine kinase